MWVGAVRGNYGVMKHEGKDQPAHRLAFLNAYGYLPDLVRHTCDVPMCVNPKHLLPGDHQSNVQDRMDRNRSARLPGRANPNAKFTEEQIAGIRRLWAEGLTGDAIATITGISRSTVYRVKHGQN